MEPASIIVDVMKKYLTVSHNMIIWGKQKRSDISLPHITRITPPDRLYGRMCILHSLPVYLTCKK